MANRYWVGGTASWDATAGSKWALTSGGAGGQAVPTGSDDVFFDAASGTVTCTVGSTVSCLNLNFTGFTGTFNQGNGINASGGLTCSNTMTVSSSANINFFSTVSGNTITTAGKTWSGFTFAGAGGVYTLGDALTLSGALTVTNGTFTTNNFNVTAGTFSSNNSNTRTINLGSSTVTLTGLLTTVVNLQNNANLTFNAGTSTIALSGTTTIVSAGGTTATGVTFNNLSFTATSATTHQISGINTFNNFTVTAPSTAGVTQITFDSRQTINGALSTTGTAGNRRVWFRGTTYGIAQTLTCNSAASLTDADFRDIYVIGTAAPISGTRIGNLGGCSGITFSTAKSVYWVTLAGGNWSGTNWAATSGGAASTDNFPLAQDTAIIENTGLNTSATVTLDSAYVYIGTLDMSSRTNAMTLAGSTTYLIFGDWKFGSGVTRTYSGTLSFGGRNTQTITSAGKSFSNNFLIDSYGGTVQLADDLNIGAGSITVTNGTFNTQGYAVTAGSLESNSTTIRAINLGSSTVNLSTNGTAVNITNSGNLTFNAGTSQINCTNNTVTIDGASITFYNVSFTGTSAATKTITGINVFNNLTITAPAAAGLMLVSCFGNQTITGTLTCAGATAVRRVFVRSNTLGTSRTITANSLAATDCDFRDITIA
ncbi:MAG: beta strand repeat-containing protein, partial [Terrimicrobiaceae bacterium]